MDAGLAVATGETVLSVLVAVGEETQPARATRMAVAVAVGNKRNVDNMAVANFYVMCIWTHKLLRKILNYLRAIHSTYLRSSLSNNFILYLNRRTVVAGFGLSDDFKYPHAACFGDRILMGMKHKFSSVAVGKF